jgi:hypothetical protein
MEGNPLHPCTLSLLLTILLTSSNVSAETITLQPQRDNTLFSDPAGALSSGAGPHLFCGNNSGTNTRRAVIAFDVASQVPPGSTIDSVMLQLHVSSAPNEISQRITVHRLLMKWGEGTSVSGGGAGAPSTADDATWLHTFYASQFWSSAGGEFDEVESAEAVVGTSGYQVWSSAAMIADAQHWLDTPEDDFGWLVKGDEASASTVRRFDSRENSTLENRPTLIIHYTPVSTPVEPVTWGALKTRYK